MTIEEKRRELFETFAGLDGWPKGHTMRHELWRAFNFALDSVCIVLPEPSRGVFLDNIDYEDVLDDVRAAIESTGLGLKVKV